MKASHVVLLVAVSTLAIITFGFIDGSTPRQSERWDPQQVRADVNRFMAGEEVAITNFPWLQENFVNTRIHQAVMEGSLTEAEGEAFKRAYANRIIRHQPK